MAQLIAFWILKVLQYYNTHCNGKEHMLFIFIETNTVSSIHKPVLRMINYNTCLFQKEKLFKFDNKQSL